MSGGGTKLLNDPTMTGVQSYTTGESDPIEREVTTPGLYYVEAYFNWAEGTEIPDTNKATFSIVRKRTGENDEAAFAYNSAKYNMRESLNTIFKCNVGDKIQASVVNTVSGATFNIQIKTAILRSDA